MIQEECGEQEYEEEKEEEENIEEDVEVVTEEVSTQVSTDHDTQGMTCKIHGNKTWWPRSGKTIKIRRKIRGVRR